MHRKVPVSVLLYNHLYPRPRHDDPTNFSGHLSKHLIPEIRVETALYYGDLLTIESRYPGLNYTYEPHIRRLSRFPHHNRLFRAVKALGITDGEILDLARWEGTLWARQRYEKDEGIKVLDTTGDDIPQWVSPTRAEANENTNTDQNSALNTAKVELPDGVLTPDSTTPAPCDPDGPEIDPVSRATSPASNPIFHVVSDDESSQQSSSEREPSVPESTPHDAPSPLPMESGLSRRLRDTITQQRRNLPSELRALLMELVNTLRANRSFSTRELARIRSDIFARLEQMQEQLPGTTFINIVSAVTLLLEQHLRAQPTAHTDVADTNAQLVPPPAA